MLPLKAQGADGREPVGRASITGVVGEVQIICRYTRRGIEREAQTVCEALRLG